MSIKTDYFLVDRDNSGEGLTPEELTNYFNHFNVKATPTGKVDQMGDEYTLEGDDEAMNRLLKDKADMSSPGYSLPWATVTVLDTPDDFDHASDGEQQRYFIKAMQALKAAGKFETSTDDDIMALAESLYDEDNNRKKDTTQNIVSAIKRDY